MGKAKVIREKTVYTHSHLFGSGKGLLEKAKEHNNDPTLILYALIGCAFALEAYLNFLGEKTVPYWNSIEKISVRSKLDVLSSTLSISVDYSRRPHQSILWLWRFRNYVAHAKTEEMCVEYDNDDHRSRDFRFPETNWEECCKIGEAEKAFADVKSVILALHEAAGLGSKGFLGITHQGSSRLK